MKKLENNQLEDGHESGGLLRLAQHYPETDH